MILQIDITEWILLQDALSGIGGNHKLSEIYTMKRKLNKIFEEQCTKKEDTDDTGKNVCSTNIL